MPEVLELGEVVDEACHSLWLACIEELMSVVWCGVRSEAAVLHRPYLTEQLSLPW